ncbi:MAG: gamma-glutamyl-gamma-aminobutyrate hydrolase family protein [Oscillospiraceae bacterium]|nr:gamma-glutamyl-gamma-aminobutyrate hydrolase family protein [Oscillospiraceae bacterium]
MLKIGFTCSTEPQNFYLRTRYTRVFLECAKAAGYEDVVPYILPIVEDPKLIRMYAEELDGFLFTGGDDVDPASYGEEKLPECGDIELERDRFELALLKEVTELQKPVFGICRGIQIMNTFLGGTLWQDQPSQLGKTEHCTKDEQGHTHHPVKLAPGFLMDLVGAEEIMTNSYHHQSVKQPGEGVSCVAFSDGEIVEAIDFPELPFFRGVQWHPEVKPDEISQALFAQFLEAVKASKEA